MSDLMRPSACTRYLEITASSFYRYIQLGVLVPDGHGPHGQPLFSKEALDKSAAHKLWVGTKQSQGHSIYLPKTERPTTDEKHPTGAIIHWSERQRNAKGDRTYVPMTCARCGEKVLRLDGHIWQGLKKGSFTGCCHDCYGAAPRRSSLRTGGRIKWKRGYIYRHRKTFTPEEWVILKPMSTPNRDYVPEHRAIIALILGRPLLTTEIVHHRNGNKENNHPENLVLTNLKDHGGLYQEMMDRLSDLQNEVRQLQDKLDKPSVIPST